MSWQLASFAIVFAALATCVVWYERSRPSSKVVAVVATMAALTALGRDAFAAVPDIKPTTAMVFVCGYVFGAGPGFAVGAVGALTSNIVLGEGPWTPWQMLAWGAVGIAAGLIGRVVRPPLGRVTLALACALAAACFNLVMDAYTWTLSGSHTLTAYLAVLVSALAFDLTHIGASFAFGFAFGPALTRMLTRVRTRLEVSWRPLGALPLAVVLGAIAVAGLGVGPWGAPVGATAAPTGATAAALAYLRGAQNGDGGFGAAVGQPSSEEFSAWAAIGLAAAGVDPLAVVRNGHPLFDALRAHISQVSGAGDLERTILALRAGRVSATSFGGRDLVAELLRQRSGDGSFQDLCNATAFAIFALRAAGRPSGDPAVTAAGRWLAAQQNPDGGFGFAARGVASDVDDTAAALQGLVDAAARDPGVARAMGFLRRQQNSDGGFPLQPGASSNAQSTAWAVQALVAAGADPAAVRHHGGPSPLDYLHSLISADGSVRYSGASAQTPVWVTAQALTALAAKPFPVGAPPPGAGAGLSVPAGPGSRSARAAARAGVTGARAPASATRSPGSPVKRDTSSVSRRRAGRSSRAAGGRADSARAAALAAMRRRVDSFARASGTLAGILMGRVVG